MFRINVFYGWWIVLACALVGAYGAGTFFYGFTAFVAPMKEEFGWSDAAIGFVASFRIVELGVAAPVMGFLVDRWGPRKLMFWGGVMAGGGFILLSYVNSLATFFGAFVFLSLACAACSGVVLTTAVAHWFHRRVSLSLGLMTAGFGMGGLLVPMVIWLIDRYSWETAFVVIGIGAWCVIPPLALLVRHRPQDYGYLPDGDIRLSESVTGQGLGSQICFRPRQAMRTRTFWVLSLALTIQFAGMNAVILYVLPYLEAAGLAAGSARWVVMFIPLLSIVGRLGFGWLGDIWPKKRVLACAMGFQAIGLLLFCQAPNWWALSWFLVTFGLGYGGVIALRPAIQREYFGLGAFGSIQGIIIAIITVGGFAGPVFAGWVEDARGDYEVAWLIFAVAAFLAAALIMATHRPRAADQL